MFFPARESHGRYQFQIKPNVANMTIRLTNVVILVNARINAKCAASVLLNKATFVLI
jgi:hypothetical protein